MNTTSSSGGGPPSASGSPMLAGALGFPVGVLGGLIGLGGAEFRLPILRGVFRRGAHDAIALNVAVSLATLLAAAAARARTLPVAPLATNASVLLALAVGATAGAWLVGTFVARLSAERLERVILVLLIGIGVLLVAEGVFDLAPGGLSGSDGVRVPAALVLGSAIGVAATLLGVAGGEMIIPTLVLVFGFDVKLAGSASVLVSLPTVVTACVRWARAGAYSREALSRLVAPMAAGSALGALTGAVLVPFVPAQILKVGLGALLIVSAVRVFGPLSPENDAARRPQRVQRPASTKEK